MVVVAVVVVAAVVAVAVVVAAVVRYERSQKSAEITAQVLELLFGLKTMILEA